MAIPKIATKLVNGLTDILSLKKRRNGHTQNKATDLNIWMQVTAFRYIQKQGVQGVQSLDQGVEANVGVEERLWQAVFH